MQINYINYKVFEKKYNLCKDKKKKYKNIIFPTGIWKGFNQQFIIIRNTRRSGMNLALRSVSNSPLQWPLNYLEEKMTV